jgi:MFS family permease
MRSSRRDFWKFLTGQTISVLGSAFSGFALPLLIFQLTHSPLSLAIATATFALPHLLFGLFIGAWVDRVDRKRLMIAVDILMALALAIIPILALVHQLNVLWIYAVQFTVSSLGLVFEQAEFTAIPSLVGDIDLVTANGRINASYQASEVAGPTIAGAIATVVSIPALLVIDSVSYLVSATMLARIKVGFNRSTREAKRSTRILADIGEGLRYVWSHPVLRNISLMMMLFNLVNSTFYAQSVYYAKERLHTSNFELGLFFAAGSVGAILFSLLAGRLRRRFSFSTVVIGCLALSGVFTVIFAFIPWLWLALPFLLLREGVLSLLNINTFSLRQAIVPDHMLGRVLSVAGVLAFSAMPLGSIAGGILIERTHNVALVFGGIGVLLFLIPLAFSLTPLGHADRFLPANPKAPAT